MKSKLTTLLEGMEVPEKRMCDLCWLRLNLPIRNSEHPDFREAFRMVLERSIEEDSFVMLEGIQ